jgi:hypothetical protein
MRNSRTNLRAEPSWTARPSQAPRGVAACPTATNPRHPWRGRGHAGLRRPVMTRGGTGGRKGPNRYGWRPGGTHARTPAVRAKLRDRRQRFVQAYGAQLPLMSRARESARSRRARVYAAMHTNGLPHGEAPLEPREKGGLGNPAPPSPFGQGLLNSFDRISDTLPGLWNPIDNISWSRLWCAERGSASMVRRSCGACIDLLRDRCRRVAHDSAYLLDGNALLE